ncbi:MAG: phosphatidylserine/phosphatidylglycerophosphate/cardiolipin synthase family protein [Candidatus Pacebacteria bacterium]|nr:phosphatidylserine/phosphatidylglycerophosphate/cardiolipin synthase family protein [Candidatus Paceibacterota bacterium]
MNYNFYKTSEKAWKAMINAISQAKERVFLELYIFLPDTAPKYDFIGILKKKAEKGVKVVIIADKFGSYYFPSAIIKELRDSGVEFLFASSWLRRTHRKILVVDDNIAFLGGVNIKKETSKWNDLQIRIKVKTLVKSIARYFVYGYKMCGGKDEQVLFLYKKSFLTKLKNKILVHHPQESLSSINAYYRDKFLKAKEKISIVTPYFTPPRWFIALLDKARLNGVEVEIIIPKRTDIKIVDYANRAFIKKLLGVGIKFYYFPEMNHAKMIIIDNQEIFVGSPNLDIFSLKLNLEIGVFIDNKALAVEAVKIVKDWKEGSELVDPKKNGLYFWDNVIIRIISWFYSIL